MWYICGISDALPASLPCAVSPYLLPCVCILHTRLVQDGPRGKGDFHRHLHSRGTQNRVKELMESPESPPTLGEPHCAQAPLGTFHMP